MFPPRLAMERLIYYVHLTVHSGLSIHHMYDNVCIFLLPRVLLNAPLSNGGAVDKPTVSVSRISCFPSSSRTCCRIPVSRKALHPGPGFRPRSAHFHTALFRWMYSPPGRSSSGDAFRWCVSILCAVPLHGALQPADPLPNQTPVHLQLLSSGAAASPPSRDRESRGQPDAPPDISARCASSTGSSPRC